MCASARALFVVFLGTVITAACAYGAQTANQKVCTPDEALRADSKSDGLKDWNAVYRFFKEFGHCDSGAVSEGSADSIVRLLVSDWNHFEVLGRLAASDKGFEKFVLRHIDELASEEELKTIAKNAKSFCPHGQTPLCEQIEASVSSLVSDTHPLLGVLEDVPGRDAGHPEVRAVRVLFQEDGGEWGPFRSDCLGTGQALAEVLGSQDAYRSEAVEMGCLKATAAQYPREVTWTVAFDGKNLGQVTTRAPLKFKFFADVGLEEITSTGSVPTIGKRSKDFSGFAEVEVYRPLVAISQPNFEDPEVWKPTKLSPEVIAALRKEFRERFSNVSNCTNPDESVLKTWPYQDDDIAIEKAYGSRKKWFVAGVKLTKYRCDGPIDGGGPFDIQWYVIDSAGTIRFLDSGMWLVDAGDYDHDGKSELVFAIDRYDMGGYELFYDEFRKHAVFKFVYH